MALTEVGQYMEAVGWQQELMSAGRDYFVERFAENLRLYERSEPCRTLWYDDEMP